MEVRDPPPCCLKDRGCRGAGSSLALRPFVRVWGRGGSGGVFWTMSIILFALWVMGLVTGSTEGYWVHLLLLFAVICLVLAVARMGRRALA